MNGIEKKTSGPRPPARSGPGQTPSAGRVEVAAEAGRQLKAVGRFPLRVVPQPRSWLGGGRQFGAERGDGRSHAACDLFAPVGTEILAVQDGKVRCDPYAFHGGTSALELEHTRVDSTGKVVVDFIVRYGEIRGVAAGIRNGVMVKQGQVIAYVGRLKRSGRSMLHFEMYGPTASGVLTRRDRPPFERDPALIDPTRYLNTWANRL